MYEGFLTYAGTEVLSRARAAGYAESSDCPVTWFRLLDCELEDDGIMSAAQYDYGSINEAPWYDPNIPESARFYGAFPTVIEGLSGSTRTATVTEGILDGGIVSGFRNAVRTVRVNALLVAEGRDALEYGMSWLTAALEPHECSQHGDACGVADAQFYAECPPPRALVPDYTEWEETRWNLAANPRGTDPVAGVGFGISSRWFGSGGTGTYTYGGTESGLPEGVDTFARKTWTGVGSAVADVGWGFSRGGRVPVTAGEVFHFRYWWRTSIVDSPSQSYIQVMIYDASVGGSTIATLSGPAVPAPAPGVWQLVEATVEMTHTGWIDAFHRLYWPGPSSVSVGSTLDATALLVEKSPDPGPYFDGEAPPKVRRNFLANPSFETDTAGWTSPRADIASDSTRARYGEASVKVTITNTSGSTYIATPTGARPKVVGGEQMQFGASIFVTEPAQSRIAIIEYRASGAVNRTTWAPDTALNVGGWTDLYFTETMLPDTAEVLLQIGTDVTPELGMEWWVDGAFAGSPGEYFDGSTGALPGYATAWDGTPNASPSYVYDANSRASWEGTENASTSILETREEFERLQTDEEYNAVVWALERYFHGVSNVSGPTVIEQRRRNDIHGYLVEFVLAVGSPFVFSRPRALDLPPTTPSIIQDVPTNLVIYPSAELSNGDDLVVATNYSTNPSVETNATGWSGTQGGAIAGGNITRGRVVGELAASGNASYRSVFTAPGASGSSGWFANEQEVLLGAGDDPRYSINIWSAQVVISGAPVQGSMTVTAYWRSSSGGSVIRTDNLGTIPVDGGALSVASVQPPSGANYVLIRVIANLNSWNAGTVVRLYSDALAVTVP